MFNRSQGFTLIELLITIVIAAILATIAVPSFRVFLQNNELSSETASLVSALQSARGTAISRGKTVSVCASNDHSTCGGIWADGWIVFLDGFTTGTVDGDDKVLHVFDKVSAGHSLTGVDNDAGGAIPVNAVTYRASGLTNTSDSTQFTFCDSRGWKYAHIVTVSPTGSLQTSDDASAGDCP